jgi:glycosyltransferase involved in cell wall biosynthesis
MRILVVGATLPWPEVTGARIRLANIVRALQQLGEIDLFVMANLDQGVSHEGAAYANIRMEIARRPHADGSMLNRVRWLARGRLPLALAGRDYTHVRTQFALWAQPPYDLVWLNRAETFAAVWTAGLGPTVVDLDDLEDRKIAHTQVAVHRGPDVAGDGPLGVARRRAAGLQGRRDARMWHTLHGNIARTVQAVVVCSEVDRHHLNVSNAIRIPNGYEYQPHPLGRAAVGHPSKILLCGFLAYPPNVDAAQYLVRVIAPRVWARQPDAQIRLVGQAGEAIQRLHAPPRVVVTGRVPTIENELARADLVAVPVRIGGGTRIKILEAFAHRIPVVSTAVGAEGLEIKPGRDLLIADAPEEFAAACSRLLTDFALRAAVTDAAHQLFLLRYRWDAIHPMIVSLGAQIAAPRAAFALT